MSHPPQSNWQPQNAPQQGWQHTQQWNSGGQPSGQQPGFGPPDGFSGPRQQWHTQQQWQPQPTGAPQQSGSGGSKLPHIVIAVSLVGILVVLAIVFLGGGTASDGGQNPGAPGGQTQPGEPGEPGGQTGGDSPEGGPEEPAPGGDGGYVAAATPDLPSSFGDWHRNDQTDGIALGEPYTNGAQSVGVLHEPQAGEGRPPGQPDTGSGEWSHGQGVLCISSSTGADALHQCVLGYADGGVIVFISSDKAAVDAAVPEFISATS